MRKKLIIIAIILIVLVIIAKRWSNYKKNYVFEQQMENDALAEAGQPTTPITQPTVFDFITSSSAEGALSGAGATATTMNYKNALIDSIESKAGVEIPAGIKESMRALTVDELTTINSMTAGDIKAKFGLS